MRVLGGLLLVGSAGMLAWQWYARRAAAPRLMPSVPTPEEEIRRSAASSVMGVIDAARLISSAAADDGADGADD